MGTNRPRAVVTGATGFVGAHLCRHLLAEGWAVGVPCRPGRFPHNLEDVADAVAHHPLADGTDDLAAFLRGFGADVVFHVAGHCVAEHASADVGALVAGNVAYGARLLEAMRASPTRLFVGTGTSWQNGDPSTDAYCPVDLYAATKEAFEKVLAHYTRSEGFRAVTLRLFDTYAETDRRMKLVNLLARCAASGEKLPLSPGGQILDLVHVSDVCRAYVRAYELLRDGVDGLAPVYGVSGGDRRTLREVVALFGEIAGKPLHVGWGERPYRRIEVMVPQPGYPAPPGWVPRVSLNDGLARVWRRVAGNH